MGICNFLVRKTKWNQERVNQAPLRVVITNTKYAGYPIFPVKHETKFSKNNIYIATNNIYNRLFEVKRI